jgi:hypothetical protein
MGLQLLPTELLARIVQETLPEGFESFALTCKSVYNASKFFLSKHNTLKRQYRNFTYRQGPHGNACTSALLLLARIAEEPLVARYIISADFVQDSAPENKDTREEHIATVVSSKILALLQNSIYVQDASVDPAILLQYMLDAYQVDDGYVHAGLAACFLLTLLPNITRVALPRRWNDYDPRSPYSNLEPPWRLDELLDAIVVRADDPGQPNAGLSKLEVILPSTGWGYENRWVLSSFNPLLSIKTVRSFCAGSCRAIDDGYTGRPFEIPKFESFGVGLEDVELVGSTVDGIELRKFLSRLPKLRSFKLSYEVKWHGCGHEVDCGGIMSAIEDEVGETLEELSFSHLNDWSPVVSYIESMKNFKKLKYVELELALLIGSQDLHNQAKNKRSIITKQRLADLLPPTVAGICLLMKNMDDRDDDNHLNHLFHGFATDVAEKFPNLKKIKIRTRPDSGGLDEQILSLDDFIHQQPGGEEAESNLTLGTEDNNAAKDSAENALHRTWMEDLKLVNSSIQVEIIKVDSNGQTALPHFMTNFCARYGVESM